MAEPDPAVAAEVDRQLEVIRQGAVQLVGEEGLRARLAQAITEDRPLRIKLGMDPSAPDLHIGHTVTLEKLRAFQDLGHVPIFLVGDFTARIGDPTGKKKTRPALEPEQVAANAQTYVDQVSLVLDVDRAEVRFNSEWMGTMVPADFVRLCSHYTVARMLERDDFQKRYDAGEPISVHEFLYPLVQGYDSVALEADVELGGTDQTFNLLVGRDLQRAYGQAPQAVLTLDLLVGTDGSEKMSKSVGNGIGIRDAPEEIYGRAMSVSDELMTTWIRALSFGRWDALVASADGLARGEGRPVDLKHALARALVSRFHGDAAAEEAAAHFARVVQRGEVPEDVATLDVAQGEGGAGLLDAVVAAGMAKSNGEARRLVAQGAVRLDGERVRDAATRLGAGSYLLQVGKRRFVRLEVG